ncbi:MAG: DegV family protein [Kurthia sp.]|nr:DegV family protein [Candidatus Kurthia equi]
MGKIHIVTDSTGGLTDQEIEDLDIHVVPLTIQIEGQTYTDRVDLTPEDFLDKMSRSKELPKSSQPAVGVFEELFNELGKDGDEVLVITMTGDMSGTVKSAESAASISDAKVTVVDSRFISFGLGFQVLEAAKMAQEGKSMTEILARMDHIRANTHLYVIIDTLENMVKGGRIGRGASLIGSLLNIKPVANLEGGSYNLVAKVRSYKAVVKYVYNIYLEDIKGKKVLGAGIEHADGLKMGEPLAELVKESGFNDLKFGFTSPIISTHTGPGAIGFSYYTE